MFVGLIVFVSCSMTDGRLLKPSYPAMSIDSTFVQRVFHSGGPDGQLWAAFTVVSNINLCVLQNWCILHSLSTCEG